MSLGHGERDYSKRNDKGYSNSFANETNRASMIQKGFDIERVNLATQNISSDTSILVIADPTTVYNDSELAKIKNYINTGGNAIILGESEHRDAI